MPEPVFFISDSAERLLAMLSAGDRPSGASSFPSAITRKNRSDLRCAQGEELADWFRKCVKAYCDDDTRKCELEPNLAVFAFLQWDEPNCLSYANINVLCSECSLEDFWLDESNKKRAQYLRLDLDYETLGPIFSHPLPHVHASPHEPAVRFEIDEVGSSNVVVDFIELVYRHLQPNIWLDWLRTVWKPHFQARATEFGDIMETIINAFKSNDIELLHRFRDEIYEMRHLLRRRKQEVVDLTEPAKHRFDLTMRPADRELLAFAAN